MFSTFSRRQLLRLISFTVAGGAVVGSVPLVGHFFVNKAIAQSSSEQIYKGRKYTVVTKETPQASAANPRLAQPVQLFLDDKEVKITYNEKSKKYITPHLFSEFNSPSEVAKQLIDLGLKFPSGAVQLDPNVD